MADPVTVYGESRWSEWFDQVREAGVVLVLCLPREIDGVAGLVEHADRVLFLTTEDAEAPDDERVVVVRAEAPPAVEQAPPVSIPASLEATESVGTRPPSFAVPAKNSRSSRKREAGVGKLLLLAFLVVILVLVVAVSLGFVSIPGITVGLSTG